MAAPADGIDPTAAAVLAAVLGTGFGSQPGDPAALRVQWLDEFPARITSFDAATQRCAWAEEDFDNVGARKLKPDGRTGTATYSPAVPVGNGLMPPDAFPVQVWLRRRCQTAAVGVVYEFDWVCACAGGGSGSGSGASGVLTTCCPGAIPTTLTATLTQTGGAACAMNGATATLAYSTATTNWSGTFTAGGASWSLDVYCTGGAFGSTISGTGCFTAFSSTLTIGSCAPLHLTGSGLATGGGCTVCPSATFTITVTE